MIKKIKSLGLMSGTSCDGLSLAFCEIDFNLKKIKLLNYKSYDYDKKIKEKILNARDLKTPELAILNFDLGKLWSKMILKFIKEEKISKKEIDLISSHGQTVYHNSKLKVTFQIGEPSFLATTINKPVISDFRPMDIASGGEGAPLVPFFDEFIFGNKEPIALLNIGGISNISIVGKNIKTIGFDTGPGNTLMDWAIFNFTKGKENYDKNGELAKKGKVKMEKIKIFMKNPFFYKKPPKSLDREEFGEKFLKDNFDFKKEKIEDILATLNYFTALTIKESIQKFLIVKPKKIIVSGGGALNEVLLNNIKTLLKTIEVKPIMDLGFNPFSKEPMAFALLGSATFLGLYNNIPAVTGAKEKRVLGKITYPNGEYKIIKY